MFPTHKPPQLGSWSTGNEYVSAYKDGISQRGQPDRRKSEGVEWVGLGGQTTQPWGSQARGRT